MSQVYTDYERVKLAQKEYDKLEAGGAVNIPTANGKEKTVGVVSQVINKKTIGEQSFIITAPTATSAERNKVKELTILYKGSTASDIGNRDVPLKD